MVTKERTMDHQDVLSPPLRAFVAFFVAFSSLRDLRV